MAATTPKNRLPFLIMRICQISIKYYEIMQSFLSWYPENQDQESVSDTTIQWAGVLAAAATYDRIDIAYFHCYYFLCQRRLGNLDQISAWIFHVGGNEFVNRWQQLQQHRNIRQCRRLTKRATSVMRSLNERIFSIFCADRFSFAVVLRYFLYFLCDRLNCLNARFWANVINQLVNQSMLCSNSLCVVHVRL